jgi:hypothetical protein
MVVNWAKRLGKSVPRNKVFDQVNSGKRAVWAAREIGKLQKIPLKTVLEEGKRLVVGELIDQEDGFPVRYRKRPMIQRNKRLIKRATLSKKVRDKIDSTQNPKIHVSVNWGQKRGGRARFVGPEKIDQFSKMRASAPPL